MFESIKTLNNFYPINTLCRVLNVNKSSYLYWLNNGSLNKDLSIHFYCSVLKVYFDNKGIYGAPKITALLNKQNIICSQSKVSRCMHILGIRSVVSKRFPHRKSSMTLEEKSLIVNLIKDLKITSINQIWTTDITYIKTINEGTYYLIKCIKRTAFGYRKFDHFTARIFLIKGIIKG